MKKIPIVFIITVCVLLFILLYGKANASTLCPETFTSTNRNAVYANINSTEEQYADAQQESVDTLALFRNGTYQFQGTDLVLINATEADWNARIATQRADNEAHELLRYNSAMRNGQASLYAYKPDQASIDALNKLETEKDLALLRLKSDLIDKKIAQITASDQVFETHMQTTLNELRARAACPLTDVASVEVPAVPQSVVEPTKVQYTPSVSAPLQSVSMPLETPVVVVSEDTTLQTKKTFWIRINSFFKLLRFW